MLDKMKRMLKIYPKIYKALELLKFILYSDWMFQFMKREQYPEVLQFPITNRCNSQCVMCNVHKLSSKDEMTAEEFRKIINDKVFKEIKAVGINGGEPFLSPNLLNYIKELVELPKLRAVYIISNGFLTEFSLKQMKEIYKICKKRNVLLNVTFSLDGYGKIHDEVRGISGAFEKTMTTIEKVAANREMYCDAFDVGCTIVQQNVDYLIELDTFIKQRGYSIFYHLAVENKRLDNFETKERYSVFSSVHAQQAAKEFFFMKIFSTNQLYQKFQYYAIFSYLQEKPCRLLGCTWKNNGITLDSKGNIYYCAVQSFCIANLKNANGVDEFFSDESLERKKKYILSQCSNCIHSYHGRPSLYASLKFAKFIIFERFWHNRF